MKNAFVLWILCLLVAVSLFGSVSGTTCDQTLSGPLSRGTMLYVGGSGPGNYTTIQDALNASVDGDTVFVYDDSAPYHEAVSINHSISLIGENKNTTVIDGQGLYRDVVMIHAAGVTVHNVTVEGATNYGFAIAADDVLISQTIVQDCFTGITLENGGITAPPVNGAVIRQNTIRNTFIGIWCSYCSNATLALNLIQTNSTGIFVVGSFSNTISQNTMRHCSLGVEDQFAGYNHYINNIFQENDLGIEIFASCGDIVEQNNFVQNNRSAEFAKLPYFEVFMKWTEFRSNDTYFTTHYRVFGSTRWKENYWEEPRQLPYVITGFTGFAGPWSYSNPLTRYAVDWHPAKQPYTIP